MVDFLYEETIKLNNLEKDEANKYFIKEDLTDKEKIAYILKKGYPNQRESLINNIAFYIKEKETIQFLINIVLDYIEIWDDSLQLVFAKSISRIFKHCDENEIYSSLSEIFNPLVKFIMKTISNNENSTKKEYVDVLNNITHFITENHKIKIESDIIDFILFLGGFGKNNIQKRFCIYFSSCIIQISDTLINSILNRFLVLCSENDYSVKMEAVCQLRLVIQDLDETYVKKNISKLLDNFLNDYNKLVSIEAIITYIICYDKFCDDLTDQNISKKIESVLSYPLTDYWSFQFELITSIMEEIIKNQNFSLSKNLFQMIKSFFIDNFITCKTDNFISYSKNILGNLPLLLEVCEELEEMDYMTEIFKYVLENVFNENTMYYSNQEEMRELIVAENEAKLIFYKNLHDLIIFIPTDVQNKLLLHRVFRIFNEENSLESISAFMHNLSFILSHMISSQNTKFLEEYVKNFPKLKQLLLKHQDWRKISQLIKVHLECEKMFMMFDDLLSELYTLSKELFFKSNAELQVEIIKLLTRLLRYGDSKMRNEILFLSENIINSSNFYIRRLYFIFFEEAFNLLSTKFLFEKKIVENFFKLLNDRCYLIWIKFFKFIPKFYYLLRDEANLKFLINTKIQNVKCSKTKDIELLSTVKYLESWIEETNNISYYSDYEFKKKEDQAKFDLETQYFSKKQDLIKGLDDYIYRRSSASIEASKMQFILKKSYASDINMTKVTAKKRLSLTDKKPKSNNSNLIKVNKEIPFAINKQNDKKNCVKRLSMNTTLHSSLKFEPNINLSKPISSKKIV